VINHLPYELYKPYLTNLKSSHKGLSLNAAIVSGVLMALTSLIAGYVAGKSFDWSTKFG